MVARLFCCLFGLSTVVSVAAQTYRFEVPKYICNLSLSPDASLQIYYELTFRCQPGADPIDIVDIGFPSAGYDLESVAAELDGIQLTTIRPSEYISVGVEIPLGDHRIMPGETAVLRVSGVNPGMAFRDSSDPDFASTEFSPTWFDPVCLRGESDCTVTFVFPQGADSLSVRHHEVPFTNAWVSDDGRVVYEWRFQRNMSSQNSLGVSYPASLITGEIATAYDPYDGWHPPSRSWLENACPAICGGVFPVGFLLLMMIAIRKGRSRRLEYLPPKLGVEGTGIKRGLTAPMAAMLLELKLDKVSALILYGLVLKSAVDLDIPAAGGEGSARPLIKRITPEPDGLHEYEKDFLAALKDDSAGRSSMDPEKLRLAFVKMVRELKEKMAGFSAKETREYYRSITSSAWRTAAGAGTPEAVGAVLSENLQWMMMDEDFDSRLGRLPGTAVFPVHVLHSQGAGRLVTGQGSINIVQACSRIAGSMESAAGGIVSSFTTLASGVTAVTNPVPVSSASSGGRSGGSSCACACACAGCACACAGGGR